MKTEFIGILIVCCTSNLFGQMPVQFTTTEVLDRYEKKFQHWGGDNETVRFMVVRKKSGKDSIVYVQCEVENKDWEKTARSSGIATGSSGGWAIGINDIQKVENRKGVIQFSAEDFGELINYLNRYLSTSRASPPEFDKTWSATFNTRFTFSLSYVQSRLSKWIYILSLDEANFEIPAEDSLEMIKKLAGFRKYLNN